MNVIEDFKEIRKRYSGVFRPQDVGIWLLIADSLNSFEGSIYNLLKSYDFDAWKIFIDFQGSKKKSYPFLSGPKILPMWLKILWEDANIPLKNMNKIPLPVDVNVAEVSFNLFFNRPFSHFVDSKITGEVRDVWNQIANNLNIPVITFDTPLWILGGNKGCSSSNHSGCKNCPVKSFCYLKNSLLS